MTSTGNVKTSNVGIQSDDSRSPTPIGTDGGLQMLGRGVKPLVQAIQTLRDLGVEILGLPLPKIVVVGDQSTGKSSLIEGISGIKVPRHAGTCTRCPLEINLVEDLDLQSQWTCKITLVTRYHHDSELVERATKNRPLGPWVSLDRADKFHFATLTSKAQVEDALYRAQLATLNIGNSHEDYKLGLPLPRDNLKVKFSPNIIQLDISGPDLPNLSFYDLPGVINVSEVAHEEYLVTLVKNLVKHYISTEDCINLLVIPMTDDAANSSASRLIREVKGARERTVGGTAIFALLIFSCLPATQLLRNPIDFRVANHTMSGAESWAEKNMKWVSVIMSSKITPIPESATRKPEEKKHCISVLRNHGHLCLAVTRITLARRNL